MCLALVLRLYAADLRIPINYLGDAITFLMKGKGILQGEWIHYNSHLGMPFGADLRDFPLNITLDSFGILIFSALIRNVGLLINTYWIFVVCLSAATATYCLSRMGLNRGPSAALGVVFALQPYGFYRGISHLHSVYYLVPLVATAAIELVKGSWTFSFPHSAARSPRSIFGAPIYVWLGCIGMGLSYLYSAFFSCFVISVATLLAFWRSRRKSDMLAGTLMLALICVPAILDLAPTLAHWRRDGRNPEMSFKNPAEAEIYGLKIRTLVTPIPRHPLAPLAWINDEIRDAKFPYETENESGRLGSIGSLGLLAMAAFLLASSVRVLKVDSESSFSFGICSALAFACIGLATVGGFSDFFNTFVAPDIRCYNRITPFIEFFSVAAFGLILQRLSAMAVARRVPRTLGPILLGGLALGATYDQAVTSGYLPHEYRQELYRSDDQFVRRIEALMPRGAEIFELPYAAFPVEQLQGRMFNNDEGRPYVHSRELRWSWGAINGTTPAEWDAWAAHLPPSEMLHRLFHRGFVGLWVDLYGYDAVHSPEPVLTQLLGTPPLRDASGRYLFYDLRSYDQRIAEAEQGTPVTGVEFLRNHPIEMTFERGFYPADAFQGQEWHWSRASSRIVLLNPLEQPRDVRFSAYLEVNHSTPSVLTVSQDAHSDTLVTSKPQWYSREVHIPANGSAVIRLKCDCSVIPSPGDRDLYFAIIQPSATDR